jgi:phage terminase large subunit
MPKLTARNALYAVVGVSDVALEQAKKFTGGIRSYADKNRDPKTFVTSTRKDAQTYLGGTARNVKSFVSKRQRRAIRAYDGLSGRGQRLVTRIRRQSATQRVSAEAEKATRQVRSAARSVKKAATAGLQASRGAAEKVAG